VDRDPLERLSLAATNLAIDAGGREVIAALRDAGVRSLLIRGPALTRWLYPNGESRAYSDVDLLVAPSHFERAEKVLKSLGFAESRLERAFAGERPPHATTWSRGSFMTIDLHHTLAGCGVSSRNVWDALTERTETMSLEGTDVEIPALAARALIVALHAGEQGTELGHPAEDVRRAISLLPDEVWSDAFRLAAGLGAEDSFIRGLRLLRAGSDLADRLGLPERSARTREPQSGQAYRIAHGLTWARSQPGLWGKTRFLARKVLPAREFMRTRSRLAQRGALGLAAAYGMRILRLLRHTPAALRGWRRSRRGA
jgi:hypothetical protein